MLGLDCQIRAYSGGLVIPSEQFRTLSLAITTSYTVCYTASQKSSQGKHTMSNQTIAIQMPQPLYGRLQRLAELTHRPLESVVVQTLDANVPPLPDDLPEEMRDDLLALENLDDEALWKVARSTANPEKYAQHSLLLEKNRLSTITKSERTTLDQLHHEANRRMLRKAYAYVLLKWRGFRLPTLAELEAQT